MQSSGRSEHTSWLRRIGYCLLPLMLGAGAALVLLWVASAPARLAYASTHTYPGCAPTIQACIDSASPGDTILISAGDYTESLTLSKAVSLPRPSLARLPPHRRLGRPKQGCQRRRDH